MQDNYISYMNWIEGENKVFKDHCSNLLDKFEKNSLTSKDISIKSQLKDIFVTSCQMSFEICSIMKKYQQKGQVQEKGYFTTPKPCKKVQIAPQFDSLVPNQLQNIEKLQEQSIHDIFHSYRRSYSNKSFQSFLLQDNPQIVQPIPSNGCKVDSSQPDFFTEKKSLFDSALNSFKPKVKKISKTRKKNLKVQKRDQKKEAIRLAQIKSIKEASEILNIPQKNIKRWICYGPERKKGAGRKTCDPQMEKRLIEWIKQYYIENKKQPCNSLLKQKAIEYTIRPSFQASKGWCDKFLKRNSSLFNRFKMEFGKKRQLI